jgi:hypothetical protein
VAAAAVAILTLSCRVHFLWFLKRKRVFKTEVERLVYTAAFDSIIGTCIVKDL